MPRQDESQLALLSPNTKPDCEQLREDLKRALNRAANFALWSRMEHNHNARFANWDGHNPYVCRKLSLPGQKPARPWNGAADLEIRLVDQVIIELNNVCAIASRRAQPHILPADLQADQEELLNKAELWGGVLEHYRELEEYEMEMARAALHDTAHEYGHALLFCGWKEEKQLVKRTLPPEVADWMIATSFINPDAPDTVELIATMLQQYDPDIQPKEARRVAKKIKPGEPCDYAVPITVRAAPDWRCKVPGLDIFYPPETTTIQKAQFIVETEWMSDVEMRAACHTWLEFDEKSVEEVIAKCTPGRASFFAGLATGLTVQSQFTWQLTSGMVGLSVGVSDMTGEQQVRQWQIIRVSYKSIDPNTGIPVLYETRFHPDLPSAPLSHKWSVNEHARYPYVEYKRELYAPTLWASRGVGELSFSEQEEIRGQANMCFDTAQLKAMPPYEASPRANLSVEGLRPGMRVDAIAGVNNGVKVLDVGGDMQPSLEVQRMAWDRAKDYYKMGMSETMDPIAKQIAQQNVVNSFVLSLKQAYKMTFAVIQQFAPDEIRYSCLHGMPVDVRVSREEILGNFSVYCEFDVQDLDPKSIEMRGKLVREFVQPLDNIGALDPYGMIRLLLMSISPTWGRQMVKKPQQASQDEIEQADNDLLRNLNGQETQYQEKGGNPALRLQRIQQRLDMPALDEKGQVMLGPDNRPIPGRAGRIYRENPDVAALVDNTMRNLQFRVEQQQNAVTGKVGVNPIQQPA